MWEWRLNPDASKTWENSDILSETIKKNTKLFTIYQSEFQSIFKLANITHFKKRVTEVLTKIIDQKNRKKVDKEST